MRRFPLFVLVPLFALIPTAQAAGADDHPGHVLPGPPASVHLSFLRPPPLEAHTLAVLQEEVARIWSTYDVEIIWTDRGPARVVEPGRRVLVSAQDRLQVLILESSPLDGQSERIFDLASITPRRPDAPRGGPCALIVTTIEGGRQMVRTALSGRNVGLAQVVEQRLVALLLGRAIAHEVGHYLLGVEHAAHGLMRESFGREDVLFNGSRRFALGPKEIERLAEISDEADTRDGP